MRKKWIAGASLIPALGIVGLLAGCDRFQSSPGEVCSAPATYDTLDGVLTSTAAPADRSHMLDRLKALISYKMVTVDAVDKDTGKVSCGALLTFTGSADGVDAAYAPFALEALGKALDPTSARSLPVAVNDHDANHVSFQIHYTVQKTQDSGQSVVTLDQASFLAQVLGRGISAADKPVPEAPAPMASAPESTPDINDATTVDNNATDSSAVNDDANATDNSASSPN